MTHTPMTQRLAAILAADVAGYTRLMEADERATVAALDANRVIFRNRTTVHGGRIVDTAGDSVLAVFPSAIGAVEAAIAIQDEMRGLNAVLPQDRRMQFRLGVNLGDVIEKDDGSVYGSGVNVAARLEGLCEPGGVVISEDLHRQVDGKVSQAFADAGSHDVKNVAEPVHAFSLGSGLADHGAGEGPALPDKPSIAVLPFDNRSSDPEQEYFADGIAEDLITELSRFDGLFVIARNSTFQLKGSGVGVAEIGRRFGVRYVVEGSVRRAGERVRISAQLTDVGEGGHVWAERYDRELNDVFAVQDDVTTQIVSAVSAELGEATDSKSGRNFTASLEAYDLYLQGRAYVERTTPVANRRSGSITASLLRSRNCRWLNFATGSMAGMWHPACSMRRWRMRKRESSGTVAWRRRTRATGGFSPGAASTIRELPLADTPWPWTLISRKVMPCWREFSRFRRKRAKSRTPCIMQRLRRGSTPIPSWPVSIRPPRISRPMT